MEVKTFGVIGAGQMGSGIVHVAAASGLSVIMNDIKQEFVDRGLANIAKNLQRGVDKGKMTAEEKVEIIKQDPKYGKVICRCETITEGEIIDVIHRSAGARTVKSVKKRCRAGMGRCQGGFCSPRVVEILARELNVPLDEIMYDQQDSTFILSGHTKSVKEEA